MRFAQFSAKSSTHISARPYAFLYYSEFLYFHQYGLTGHQSRSFKGIGPSLSWNASTALAGNKERGELTLDWGIEGAMLFGRQKAKTDHATHAYQLTHPGFWRRLLTAALYPGRSYNAPLRSRNVIVPDVSGFIGLSAKLPHSKITIGYKGDIWFGAVDRGIDCAQDIEPHLQWPLCQHQHRAGRLALQPLACERNIGPPMEDASMDEADGGIVFRSLWGLDDPKARQDAKNFWLREGVTPEFIDLRINELCAIAYDGDDPVAVATAQIAYAASLRNKFFRYRCMVASHFRQRDMAWRISSYAFKQLQDWSLQHPEEKILGLMLYIETDKFAVPQREPVREHLGMTLNFVGYSPKGQQVRIVWFDHAKLEDDAAKQADSVLRPPATT